MGTNRISRAAMLAGVLAAPACWRTTSPPADKPAPVRYVVASGTITGVVTNLYDKQPVLRMGVTLRAANGETRSSLTDEKGRYAFRDLPAGTYVLEWYSRVPNEAAPAPVKPTTKTVELERGGGVEVNIAITRPPPYPVITPYGAPPARVRRV